MKGKRITIGYIIFFGFTASISYFQKDFYGVFILTIPFIYYGVKFLRKFK